MRELGDSFFLCLGFRRNEYQQYLRKRWRRERKVVAYFDIASGRIANLSLYCQIYHFPLLDDIPSEQAADFCSLPLIPSKPIAFIPRGANTQKIKRIDHRKYNVRASKNANQAYFLSSSSLLTSPLIPKDYCIHSFWRQNTENKKNRPQEM